MKTSEIGSTSGGQSSAPIPAAPPEALMQLAMGGMVAQALAQVARYEVADHLAKGPSTVNDLAALAGVNADSLGRVLRCLEPFGLVEQIEPGTYKLLPMGEWLRSDVAGTLAPFVRMMTDDWQWRSFGRLDYSVASGESSFERLFGMPAFDYLWLHPGEAASFERAMVASARHHHRGALATYDLSGVASLVDVGGGKGERLAAVLQDNPHLRGVLFEQARLVEDVAASFAAEGLTGRWSTVGADLFSDLPAGHDVYLLARVIHVWNEERALKLLGNVKRALPPHGKVLLLESIVPDSGSAHISKVLDLVMLTVCGSRERTADEYVRLLANAGLKVTRIQPTETMVSVIEAVHEGAA